MSGKNISAALSAKMANMALTSAFLVVAMHAFSMSSPPVNGSVMWWVNQVFRLTVTEIAVPYFFLASGYFLARHCDETGWWHNEVKKRVRSLLIPLAIWLALTILIRSLGFIVGNIMAHRPLSTGLSLPSGYFINAQYFLRSLFLFIVLSPIIVWAIRRIKLCFILILALSYYLLAYFDLLNGWTRYFFPVRGFAYFSFGMYLRMRGGFQLPRYCAWWIVLAFVGVMVCRIFRMQSVPYSSDPLWYASVPLCLFAVWHFMPSRRWPEWLLNCSFPIYLMHAIMYYLLFGTAEVFRQRNFASESLIGYLIAVMIAFLLPVAIANGLRLWSKRFHAVLFGGR